MFGGGATIIDSSATVVEGGGTVIEGGGTVIEGGGTVIEGDGTVIEGRSHRNLPDSGDSSSTQKSMLLALLLTFTVCHSKSLYRPGRLATVTCCSDHNEK